MLFDIKLRSTSVHTSTSTSMNSMQGNAGSVADIVGIVDIKLRSTVHTSTSMSSDALAARWWQVLLLILLILLISNKYKYKDIQVKV